MPVYQKLPALSVTSSRQHVPLYSELLSVCAGSSGEVWGGKRGLDGGVENTQVQPVFQWRIRSCTLSLVLGRKYRERLPERAT